MADEEKRKAARKMVKADLPTPQALEELGRSGTPEYGGYVSADYNPEFNGKDGVDLCDRMRRTDGTVGTALRAVKYPIMATDWTVEPADSNDEAQVEIAEFVRQNLMDRMDFVQFVREALGYLDFGFWYFEKVYEHGDEGRMWLKKLASRLPTAHEKWETRDGKPGVMQTLPSRKPGDAVPMQPSIPMEKLVLFVNEREGDNLAGVPLLRSAYKHFFMKDQLYRIDAVKHERGAGILKIRCPGDDMSMAKAKELGENFNSNEQAYIVLPGPKPEQGQPGWDAEIATAGIGDQSDALMESVKHHDRAIVQNILASFLDLGAGTTGSFALGDAQKSFFGYALKAVADYFASVVNEQLVKELVRLNFGEQESYPKLKAPRIGQMDQKATADVLAVLNNAGLIDKDPELRAWVTRAFGLPERTAEEIEERDEERRAIAASVAPVARPKGPEGGNGRPGEEDAPEEGTGPKKGHGGGELAEKWKRRPLTLAETRVKFAEKERDIDTVEGRAKAALEAMTERQKAKALEKAGRIIAADDIDAVAGFSLDGDPEGERELQAIARQALDGGKVTAANELGVAAPATTSYAKKALKAKVASFVADRGDRITAEVRKRLADILNNDVGKAAGLFDLEKAIAKAADMRDRELIGQVTLTPIAEGRWLTFDDMRDQIHALQRSELLDGRTCDTCLSLDGRIISQSDPFSQLGQVHEACRGDWVAILKTDADLPEPKPIPKSIASKFDLVGGVPTTNRFVPLEKVITPKDSRVARKVEDGELVVTDVTVTGLPLPGPGAADRSDFDTEEIVMRDAENLAKSVRWERFVSEPRKVDIADLYTDQRGKVKDWKYVYASDRDDVASMVKAINEGRPLPPIEAFEMKDGSLTIIDGNHRAKAHQVAGKGKIVAVVRKFNKTDD